VRLQDSSIFKTGDEVGESSVPAANESLQLDAMCKINQAVINNLLNVLILGLSKVCTYYRNLMGERQPHIGRL
jgi:hypothetical protein